MYILIVNGFEDSPKGTHDYCMFRDLVVATFRECQVLDCFYLERRLNRLGDLVVDWEFDSLNDVSRENCKHFDKIDFVFISGDMKICPWEPLATQVVTLIHMCKFMDKPIYCSGFGAFTAIYTLATKGARFHMLNGPDGEEIEHLAAFPRYSIGSGAFPSGWFDNETGDLYTYNRKSCMWDPVCNLGIYRIAANGTPSSNRHAPLVKKYSREDHTLDSDQVVEPLDCDATVARIRNVHIQHYSMKGFEAQNFSMKEYPHWFIRTDGSLPAGEGLCVVADGEKGAVVLAKSRMLMVSSKVDKSMSYASCRRIMTNYVLNIMKQIKQANRDKLESSMLEFLFGADGVSGGTYDSMIARKKMSPPLSRTSVPTTVPQGPVKVDPPVIGMFLYTPKQDNVDYLALTANRKSSTIGRTPKLVVQNPLQAKHKRLEILSAKVGGINVTAVAAESLAISRTLRPDDDDGVPEQVKELFTGIVMNTKSVSRRRSPRTAPVPDVNASASSDASQAPPDTDWDLGADNYELDQHIRPFGESLVVPGTSGSVKSRSVKIGSSYRPILVLEGTESVDSCDKAVTFSDDAAAVVTLGESMVSTMTSNNVPFVAFQPAPRRRPQQPSTPQSTASACRLASQINREFRQRAQTAQSAEATTPVTAGKRPFTSPSITGPDENDSSEDESGDFRVQVPPQPSLVSALSVDSVGGASGWSSIQLTGKVPPIQNWGRALQTAPNQLENSVGSFSARPTQSRFNSYGSNLSGSQTQRAMTSSLLAPTMSSMHRTTLTSTIGAPRQPAQQPGTATVPLPGSPRTAQDISSTLRSLHMPVQRPKGPIHRRKVKPAHIEPEISEMFDDDDGQSFVYLAQDNGPEQRSGNVNDVSKFSTYQQYQSDPASQVLLPTTPSERPYSSYQKITQTLAEKQKSEDRNYPGAFVRPFLHPEEVKRKEYVQSKQKFLAGAFKTSFGPGQSSLEVRQAGGLRAEGAYPLEPFGPVSSRPENTTAIHFAAMQRSNQPHLAGDWKW